MKNNDIIEQLKNYTGRDNNGVSGLYTGKTSVL